MKLKKIWNSKSISRKTMRTYDNEELTLTLSYSMDGKHGR